MSLKNCDSGKQSPMAAATASLATLALEEPDLSVPDPEDCEDRLVVGIDFGTTYSGVAAVYSATPDDIDIVKSWPGGNGITSDKVPTEIAYSIPNPAGSDAIASDKANAESVQIKWGFQFKPEDARLRCIKLFLDRDQRLPHFVSPLETAALLRNYDRTVLDAVTDFMRKLYEHTMETLTRRYGESFVNSTTVSFVLTVPAVWSHAAQTATLQAAEKAGMGERHNLRLISEPEAAAVYTLKSMQPSSLKVGDNYVICDAGGGTVDLIAYKVIQVSPLRIEESNVGSGGLCGSAMLNYRFEDAVRERIGEERYTLMRDKKPKTWAMGLKYFEEFVKRNFNEEEHSEVNVPFPGLPDDEDVGLDSGFLVMTAGQVKAIFGPIIAEVIDLVEGQVNAIRDGGGTISGIILVGGFGQSNYLYQTLKKHFNTIGPPPYAEKPSHVLAEAPQQAIEVLQPLHAWTAVVRGAVLRGLEGNLVETRQARFHYGTSYATVFDESKHPVADRYWSPLWEKWMISDRMQWHIAKGTSVSAETPITFHYTRNFRPAQSLVVEDELIACDQDEAPDAYNKTLRSLCTLTTDLSAVPPGLFTMLTTTKGVEFLNLDFSLCMYIETGLVFELRVDGKSYGSVRAEFH
ncbi:putative Heat shock protein 70 family [Septoria linicola]|nr:putative Heat shock protein 70 family [Septoria linicola]